MLKTDKVKRLYAKGAELPWRYLAQPTPGRGTVRVAQTSSGGKRVQRFNFVPENRRGTDRRTNCLIELTSANGRVTIASLTGKLGKSGLSRHRGGLVSPEDGYGEGRISGKKKGRASRRLAGSKITLQDLSPGELIHRTGDPRAGLCMGERDGLAWLNCRNTLLNSTRLELRALETAETAEEPKERKENWGKREQTQRLSKRWLMRRKKRCV